MIHKYKSKWQGGQTLLEAVISLGIATMVIVALVAATTVAVSRSRFVNERTQAEKYTQEGLEWVRAERDKDWDTVKSRAGVSPGTRYCLNSLTWSGSGSCPAGSYLSGTTFTREAILTTTASPQKIQVKMTVSWQEGGRTHISDQTTYFTNW